jgi:hypothetical protein
VGTFSRPRRRRRTRRQSNQHLAEVVAEENEAQDSNDKPKRKRGERTGDKKKRACRTCTRCVSNNGTNGKICKGRHPCNGAAKCEFFDAGGVKRKGKQNIDEEEDASTKKDGYGGVFLSRRFPKRRGI